jgi:hypothetical protein
MDLRPFLLLAAATVLGACGDGVSGPPFQCGSQTCQAGNLCFDEFFYGLVPPDDYGCAALPSACSSTPTCECLRDHGQYGGCSCEDEDGHPVVTCEAP